MGNCSSIRRPTWQLCMAYRSTSVPPSSRCCICCCAALGELSAGPTCWILSGDKHMLVEIARLIILCCDYARSWGHWARPLRQCGVSVTGYDPKGNEYALVQPIFQGRSATRGDRGTAAGDSVVGLSVGISGLYCRFPLATDHRSFDWTMLCSLLRATIVPH